jgi:hypothetical protein
VVAAALPLAREFDDLSRHWIPACR